MVMRNISEAKSELSSLIELVLKGKEVIIAKAGKPVARIVPYGESRAERKPGSMTGEIHLSDDFDQLPDDIAEAFGAGNPSSRR